MDSIINTVCCVYRCPAHLHSVLLLGSKEAWKLKDQGECEESVLLVRVSHEVGLGGKECTQNQSKITEEKKTHAAISTKKILKLNLSFLKLKFSLANNYCQAEQNVPISWYKSITLIH